MKGAGANRLALIELGVERHTLILFTSENELHREGGPDHEFFDSNGLLQGYKRDLFGCGYRARWPGTVEPGPVSSELPEAIAGKSFVPTPLGRPKSQQDHGYLYRHRRSKVVIRQGKWKACK